MSRQTEAEISTWVGEARVVGGSGAAGWEEEAQGEAGWAEGGQAEGG